MREVYSAHNVNLNIVSEIKVVLYVSPETQETPGQN